MYYLLLLACECVHRNDLEVVCTIQKTNGTSGTINGQYFVPVFIFMAIEISC